MSQQHLTLNQLLQVQNSNVSTATKTMMVVVIRMMMREREEQHVENWEAWKAVSLGQIGPETECVGTSVSQPSTVFLLHVHVPPLNITLGFDNALQLYWATVHWITLWWKCSLGIWECFAAQRPTVSQFSNFFPFGRYLPLMQCSAAQIHWLQCSAALSVF